MDYQSYEKKLSYLLELTEKGRLLSPGQAAVKMGCSKRTIFRMLGHLKSKDHCIYYSRSRKRYCLNGKR